MDISQLKGIYSSNYVQQVSDILLYSQNIQKSESLITHFWAPFVLTWCDQSGAGGLGNSEHLWQITITDIGLSLYRMGKSKYSKQLILQRFVVFFRLYYYVLLLSTVVIRLNVGASQFTAFQNILVMVALLALVYSLTEENKVAIQNIFQTFGSGNLVF